MMSLPCCHATCTNQPAAVYFTAYNHPLSSHWARASQLSLSVWLWFILGHWVSNKLHPHPVSPAASSRHHPYPATYHTLPCQVDTFTWGRSQNSAEHKIRHLFWAQMPKFCNRSGTYVPFFRCRIQSLFTLMGSSTNYRDYGCHVYLRFWNFC